MPRFRETIPVDDYVLDVLMRDIVEHDRHEGGVGRRRTRRAGREAV